MVIALKLLISFSLMTEICTVAWEDVMGSKYFNVDDYIFLTGFLIPGAWVDDTVVAVKEVVPPKAWHHLEGSGYYPDQIQEGWSVARLWRAWWCFFAADVFCGLALVIIPWRKSILLFRSVTHYPDWLAGFIYVPLGIFAVLVCIPVVFWFTIWLWYSVFP